MQSGFLALFSGGELIAVARYLVDQNGFPKVVLGSSTMWIT
jgi:hypothetical protein